MANPYDSIANQVARVRNNFGTNPTSTARVVAPQAALPSGPLTANAGYSTAGSALEREAALNAGKTLAPKLGIRGAASVLGRGVGAVSRVASGPAMIPAYSAYKAVEAAQKAKEIGLGIGGDYGSFSDESLNRSHDINPTGAIDTRNMAPEKLSTGWAKSTRPEVITQTPALAPAPMVEEVKGDLAPWDNRVEAQDYGRGITEIIGGYNQKGRSFTNLIPAGASKVGIHEMTRRFQEEPQGVSGALSGVPSGNVGGEAVGGPMSYAESLGAVTDGAIPTSLAGFAVANSMASKNARVNNENLKFEQGQQGLGLDQELKQAQIRGALADAGLKEKSTESMLNKQDQMKQNKIMSLWGQLDKATDPQAKAELAQLIEILQAEQTPEYVEPRQGKEAIRHWLKPNEPEVTEVKGGWKAKQSALPVLK